MSHTILLLFTNRYEQNNDAEPPEFYAEPPEFYAEPPEISAEPPELFTEPPEDVLFLEK
ncbi:MAG: hypothetical protein J5797_10380 [Prevotella sp.]|nr:hypothetical protein [Prevotella sp.]